MTVPTPDVPDPAAGQIAIDDADAAAGFRTVLDVEEAGELLPSDPNLAAGDAAELDHLEYVGDSVDDDDVTAVNRALTAQGGLV